MSLDAKQIYQLRSAARRGLLENDLILERFFHRFAHELNEEQGKALSTLLQLDDNDLLVNITLMSYGIIMFYYYILPRNIRIGNITILRIVSNNLTIPKR